MVGFYSLKVAVGRQFGDQRKGELLRFMVSPVLKSPHTQRNVSPALLLSQKGEQYQLTSHQIG